MAKFNIAFLLTLFLLASLFTKYSTTLKRLCCTEMERKPTTFPGQRAYSSRACQ
jgi:hypothetical protein